ncbi:glycosyltransferase family 2 protein [Chryseobacterium sp. CT-SW4]|uniref:glycosyltransferase family 2 protein n=1 Tax=Chryseobacterium sp. SW-1 TaxID=3157343 RepID=UPI003B01F4D2
MTEKVTVIVPCYNSEPYIRDCLNSILAQSYENWECVIVNDGSPDNIEEAIQPYLSDSRFKYVSQENKGLPGARNTGIENSSGKYILPLDADDALAPLSLEKMVEAFQKYPEALVIYSDSDSFGGEKKAKLSDNIQLKDLLVRNQLYCASMYKKEDIGDKIRYDNYLKIGVEDWEFWIHLMSEYRNRPFKKIDYPILQKRTTEESMLGKIKKDEQRSEKIYNYIYQKHLNLYNEFHPSYVKLLTRKLFYEQKLEHIYSSKPYRIYNFFAKLFK